MFLGYAGRTCTCPPGYVGNGIGAAGCVSQGPVTGPCGSTPCMNGGACQVNSMQRILSNWLTGLKLTISPEDALYGIVY